MIFVFRYATYGSLDYHLQDDNKRRCLTWEERLNICLGAARGLDYLHQSRIIHRDVKSGNILIADGMEAKVGDFGLSKSGFNNRLPSQVHTNVAGTNVYLDPLYNESSILTKESDVYSFGVVLFEMVSGVLAYRAKDIGDGQPRPLLNLVRRFCENGVEKLIDPHIRDQLQEVPYLDPQIEDNIEISSFYTFIDIAYMCISLDIKKRPTMKEIIRRLKKALDNRMNSPLIKCVMGDTRFSYGKPVMAFTIYNDLVHFHSFGHDLFDRLIQILYVAVKTKHTIEYMVYLSANVLVLNFLNNLDYRSKLEWYNGVELMEYVVKLYGIISDRLKNEVGSLLDLHILAIMASKDSDDLSTWLTDHLNQLEENFYTDFVGN
uniref:probable receptor-like protein kinase At2g23200 n=1 Tax=Erigeron canadensis TaxID=72917 RepID=UPI001CB8CC69|nr:probable receptor-like protein kinase At2g23200 [Erigeron canadensis]